MPKTKKSTTVKAKGLFDHLNQITAGKKADYWKELSESERKTFSSFMINRFISMAPDYIELVNEIQQYGLSDEQVYRVYMDLLPKQKMWNKYIKGAKTDSESYKILAEHYELGTRDVKLALDLMPDKERKLLIKEIKAIYGERYNDKPSKTKRKKGS